MNDLDICKRIAEIEGTDVTDWLGVLFKEFDPTINPELILNNIYDPLTDDALCFQLMVKYKVELEFVGRLDNQPDASIYDDEQNRLCFIQGTIGINKAILLAIIEAHKND